MLKPAALSLLALGVSAWAQTAPAVPSPQAVGFATTRTFPYSMAGKLIFAQGDGYFQASGTLVRPSSVLTAAHNLWHPDTGFSTDLLFRRALAGQDSAGDRYASRVYVLAGYRETGRSYGVNDARTFAFDLGAVLFPQPVAGGSSAGWAANPRLLTANVPTFALGYGAQQHDGTQLLGVTATAGYRPVVGAFYQNFSVAFEAGMSGGPVFAWDDLGNQFVSGVVVAGAVEIKAGGIRVLDSGAASFIRGYMK